MDQSSFSYKTLRNSAYLFMGFVLPMVFTIFVTRELAGRLGAGEFGIFLLANAISAFVGYVDLGLTTAIAKYTAEYHARGNLEALRNILSSGRILFFVTGILGLLIFLVLGYWFLPFFHVSTQSVSHIFIVFALAGLVFFFNSISSVYSGILTALQRFDLITKLNMANLIFVSLGTIGLLRMGYRLKAVMALNVLASFLMFLLVMYLSRKLLPTLRLGLFVVKAEIKKAYKFGLLTFVSNLAGGCLIYVDRLVIPIFLGPSQLAFYSMPGNVALKTTSVTNSLGGMFFPMASAMQGAGEMDKLKSVYIRAFRNLSVIAAAVTVAIILYADKILLFWLGAEYAARGAEVLVILALTNYLIALYIPLQGILLGLSKLSFLIRQSLAMAAVNLILLLIMVPRWGITGAAWAYLISVLPMTYAFYWTERNVFSIISGQSRHYILLYAKLLFIALVDGLIIYFWLAPLATNVWRLVIVGPLSVLLYMFLYLIFRFSDREDEIVIKDFIFRIFKKKFKSIHFN